MSFHLTSDRYPLEKVLRDRFHINSGFHLTQRDIIERLIRGQRVLAIQRTGWGKSLCYQMASLYYPGLTIVFSPLKALMRDQYQRCNDDYNIPAAVVSSEFSEEENRVTLQQALAGKFKILFIAPERLNNADWQLAVQHMRISMIVIDEAHCISIWGHDFRPDYRRIVNLMNALPANVPVLALTATANQRVERDILQQIGETTQRIRGTMQRPNLHTNVVTLHGDREKLGYLAAMLPQCYGTGLLYSATRSGAEIAATFLQKQGINAVYYHAGLEENMRRDIEQKLMENFYKVVCSTNALGMGIDKRDIRFVIHYHVPASPINFYQEMGRAGRDGTDAACILLYDREDLTIQEYFISNAKPATRHYEAVLSLLQGHSGGLRESDVLRVTGLSRGVIRKIFSDLEEQNLIRHDKIHSVYIASGNPRKVDFTSYDEVRQEKLRELADIQNYAQTGGCYMGYLTAYLGDPSGYICGTCGHCHKADFPLIEPTERMLLAVDHFLEKECLPRIEKYGSGKKHAHEAGWSLSYHGTTRIGTLVRLSKYESGGPFAQELVSLAVEAIRTRYPIANIDGIVSVPPTKSGKLVEMFALSIAGQLGIEYIPALIKARNTGEQKNYTNRIQKEDNVKGAFKVPYPGQIAGRTLLMIDDIYDSGQTMHEVGQTLMRAGAKTVYPFTITRTIHSDDQ